MNTGFKSSSSFLAVAMLASACGSASVDSPEQSIDPAAVGSAGSELSGSCQPYPVQALPAPGAEAKANAALARLADEAGSDPEMVWSSSRATFKAVYGLSYPLTGCSDPNRKVEAVAWNLLNKEPDLFRLSRTDWQGVSPKKCGDIDVTGTQIALRRVTMGGYAQSQDVIFYIVRRVAGVVRLESLSGDYLPVASPALVADMGACPALDPVSAKQAVRAGQFNYSVFDNCFWVGQGTYAPQKGDSITIETTTYWEWQDAPSNDHVVLRRLQPGSLVVAPANVTPELSNSDANCGSQVGFSVTFDSVMSQIHSYMPGIGCVVC